MTAGAVRTAPVVAPLWLRARFWLLLAAVVLLGAIIASLFAPRPGRALDPSSPSRDGSKALAVLLRQYGAPVVRTTDATLAGSAGSDASVVLVSPEDYSDTQLRALTGGPARVVLLAPSARVLAAVGPGIETDATGGGTTRPGCTDPGAVAAGPVELPGETTTYTSAAADVTTCYGGALAVDGRLAVLGSAGLLGNDTLAGEGVAALDVNIITDDRTLRRVVWLLPGADAAGPGAPTLWQLFPAGAHRAFDWLLVLGVLVVLWRVRRLGPPVEEPLPVLVRAAEVVEGHGRLYRRARARERAGYALRAGTASRLTSHLGVPRRAGPAAVVAAAAAASGQHPTDVERLLGGPPPADDTELVALAVALAELETTAGLPSRPKGTA